MAKTRGSRRREPKPAPIREKNDEKIAGRTLAKLFDLSARRVQQLADAGVLTRHSHGYYEASGAGAAIAKSMLEIELSKHEAKTAPARTDFDLERARNMRLRNDQAEGLLIETQAALNLVDWIFGTVRSDLAGLPAALTDDVAERRRIENVIDQTLAGLADGFRKARDHTRSGGDVSDPAFADVARRMVDVE
jgi:phage terminase Nu1 subunit (DNA packaging protein)